MKLQRRFVDLSPFGVENNNEVFIAADRPYGLIEASVVREGGSDPGDAHHRVAKIFLPIEDHMIGTALQWVSPDKIVMGDGIMAGYEALGFGDIAPQAIYAHEFGVLHGARTYVLQDEDGQTADVHSVSAGLDYAAVCMVDNLANGLGASELSTMSIDRSTRNPMGSRRMPMRAPRSGASAGAKSSRLPAGRAGNRSRSG